MRVLSQEDIGLDLPYEKIIVQFIDSISYEEKSEHLFTIVATTPSGEMFSLALYHNEADAHEALHKLRMAYVKYVQLQNDRQNFLDADEIYYQFPEDKEVA